MAPARPPSGPERGTSDARRAERASAEAYYASRTLQALELLAVQDLSCPQVAATMQIHPRTARRLLVRLAADGFIEQTFDRRRRYRATLRLAALGCQVIAHAQLPRIAAPFVAELCARTRAVAHLVIPSYRDIACVAHCEDPDAAQPPEPMLRERLPPHATAAGKVLLAYRQPWRDGLLREPLGSHTERTITAPAEIERAAARTRTLGYAIDDGEYKPGTLAIAAAVFVDGRVPAALAVSTSRHDRAAHSDEALIENVMSTAGALTRALNPGASATS
jgi:DNA-binding IclR family transcriptional regulator